MELLCTKPKPRDSIQKFSPCGDSSIKKKKIKTMAWVFSINHEVFQSLGDLWPNRKSQQKNTLFTNLIQPFFFSFSFFWSGYNEWHHLFPSTVSIKLSINSCLWLSLVWGKQQWSPKQALLLRLCCCFWTETSFRTAPVYPSRTLRSRQ